MTFVSEAVSARSLAHRNAIKISQLLSAQLHVKDGQVIGKVVAALCRVLSVEARGDDGHVITPKVRVHDLHGRYIVIGSNLGDLRMKGRMVRLRLGSRRKADNVDIGSASKLEDLKVHQADSKMRLKYVDRLLHRCHERCQIVLIEVGDANVPCLSGALGSLKRLPDGGRLGGRLAAVVEQKEIGIVSLKLRELLVDVFRGQLCRHGLDPRRVVLAAAAWNTRAHKDVLTADRPQLWRNVGPVAITVKRLDPSSLGSDETHCLEPFLEVVAAHKKHWHLATAGQLCGWHLKRRRLGRWRGRCGRAADISSIGKVEATLSGPHWGEAVATSRLLVELRRGAAVVAGAGARFVVVA